MNDVQADQPASPRPRRPTRSIPHEPPNEDVATLVSSPTTEQPPSTIDLTPLRAHYLKKSLIQLQFNQELDAITSPTSNNVSTLSYLGPPFASPPKNAPMLDLPFLRYIFRQFVLTFPFMASAPKDFYAEKLQPFVGSALSRNISPTSVFDDGSETEQALRLRLLAKAERNLSLFFSAATKLAEPEEVVRLSQADLDRLEAAAAKRQAKMAETVKDYFEVNIVSVRAVVDKGRVRSRVHEEFIVRTRRSNFPDVFVSRRYGDFRALALELRKAHPAEDIRSPPVKDRTTVSAPASAASPLSPAPTLSRQSTWDGPSSPQPQTQAHQNSRMAREKNRLTLRAYLHGLLANYTIASSPVLRSFLLSGPTTLNRDEVEDAVRREEADRVRDDGRKQFAREIASRVDGLREAVKSVRGDIMGKDGLTQIFATVKVTPNVRDLPPNYRAVLEWARMSLASTIFHTFVASDSASETFSSLKRIHGLMPYLLLKAAMRISNPIAMIRSVLDLFLAQPFGGRSLLQRMFTGSLTEEVRALEEEIEAVKAKVDDPMICEKIRQFVYAPREIQDMLRADAAAENMDLITIVLRAADPPFLSRAQMHRVAKGHRAHQVYLRHRETLVDSDDDDGPQDEDGWLFEDLKVLANLYSRLRDREQLIELLFEGSTSELLKDIITIFYTPLAQVYRAASIADSLGDLQSFINDLIKTVEQSEDLSQEDPHRTVQAFVNLVERHEQSFYHFVHKVHSKGEGLFDSLMRWIELFLTVVREGLGGPVSLEFLLPHTGPERQKILAEVDQVALYHYKLKVLYEDKLRRRFGRTKAGKLQSDADAEDEATKALVDGVAQEINFGELISGDAVDLAAEETDEEESDESSEDETSSEDSDESSEESSDEEDTATDKTPVATPRPTPQRLKALPQAPVSSPMSARPRNQAPTPTPPQQPGRQRSLSLKSSRSLTFLREQFGQVRRSEDSPPVPPLPKSLVAAMNKPLPASPSPMSPAHQFAPPPAPPPTKPLPPKRKARKRRNEVVKPPELEHIPQLLSIFKEMMRPHLAPRQRTN
ncbi:PX-domain-containing protein [Mycena indigotica]|uniref:PX-domain-containing protein n=1 Tax=Mycena indigotica TaxID=2126181 RepID=A0A8H6SL08_9AGAR|nr:PX-domain-containing protein [Mycena indigotica]KAF7301685.1 PX-domain-containing protein [Mycena indigotica]